MLDLVQIPGWRQYAWLQHGFSTRTGGVSTVYGQSASQNTLNLGWTQEDDPAHVAENRRLLTEAVTGASGSPLIAVRQVHATDLHVIRSLNGPFSTAEGKATLEGDGLATSLPGAVLGIQTADCVPVMLVDPVQRAVAVLHAGWRGTAAAMAGHGVARMVEAFGSRPGDLQAAIGPSIGSCCYTVGEEVRDTFHANFPYAAKLFTDDRLDLWEANRQQLLTAGFAVERIHVVAECTGCARTSTGERRYFSHRIDHGVTGRMMSLIGVRG